MVEFFKSKKKFPSQELAKGDSAHNFSLTMSFYDVKNCLIQDLIPAPFNGGFWDF